VISWNPICFLDALMIEESRSSEKSSFEASKNDKVFKQMREIGHRFQAGLDRSFSRKMRN